MPDLSPQAQNLVQTVEALPPAEQQAAMQFLNDRYFPKQDKYKTQIWLVLLSGLFVLGLAAIVATIILEVKDKDGTAWWPWRVP